MCTIYGIKSIKIWQSIGELVLGEELCCSSLALEVVPRNDSSLILIVITN